MKKGLLFLGILSSLAFFTSCEKDVGSAPEIAFTNGETSAAVDAGESYTITGTITSEEGLANVKYIAVTSSGEDQLKMVEDFNDKNNYQFQYTYENATENIVIKVEATDKEDQTTSRNFTINVNVASLTETTNLVLGAQSNTNGSFYASLTGATYTVTSLKTASAYSSIDVVYYYGATNKATLFSPKAIVDNNITWSSAIATTAWGTANATKFVEVTKADYTSATVATLETLTAGASAYMAADLAANDTYAFVTAGGKIGIFTVVSVGTDATGTVTISVKIEE